MEDHTSLLPIEAESCACCYTQVNAIDSFCDSCGYPLKGSETEQHNFISNRAVNEIDLEEYNVQIKKASTALYWIAGFNTLWGVIFFATNKELATLIVSFIIAIIFIGLGAWTNKKPFAAIVSGACLYAILIILSAIASPLSILSGIIWKIVIIGAFVRGIKAAVEAEKLKKEFNLE